MLIEFETINFTSVAKINSWSEIRVIDHELVYDFIELEDGTLQINLYNGEEFFITRSYSRTGLIDKLKNCETII